MIHPIGGTEMPVVVLYAEGTPAEIERIGELARGLGMTIAVAAPDSLLAVSPKGELDVGGVRGLLAPFAAGARIALGTSRATIQGALVDGPALDAESWAPYPLPDGLWVAADL